MSCEDEKVLTIVVPSYNVGDYLRRCIDSIIASNALGDIEVIIVDDGSSDSTIEIADEYESAYPNDITVIHKENGGYGSTINAAIRPEALINVPALLCNGPRGRFLCVIDGDDYVDSLALATLIESARTNSDVDIILYDSKVVSQSGEKLDSESIRGADRGSLLLDSDECRIETLGIHNSAISVDVLRDNGIACHEHHFYVDSEYILRSLLHCSLAYYCGEELYQYAIGRSEQSVSPAMRLKHFDEYMEVHEWICDLYEENRNHLAESKRRIFKNIIEGHCIGVYGYYLQQGTKEAKSHLIDFDNQFKASYSEIYDWCNNRLSVRLLRKTNFALFGIASMAYRSIYARRRYQTS